MQVTCGCVSVSRTYFIRYFNSVRRWLCTCDDWGETVADGHFVTHLECSLNGETDYEAGRVHGLSRQGRPLLTRYDLDAVRRHVDRDAVWSRDDGFWKWRALLPVREEANVTRLGEIDTPIVACPRLMRRAGGTGLLLIKDEGRLPTGSFKARGLALAVSMARELGLTRLAIPTNGNAGAALAAYAARAGLEAYVFCPDDTPTINIRETALQGARVWRVNGLINDCGKIVGDGAPRTGWFEVSTLKEPYRLEGKKTMGLELAAQLGWRLPDAIFYPTGGGTGLIGMWKAFAELAALGWVTGRMPKMFAVQSASCAPIVRAFEQGDEFAAPWEGPAGPPTGIRVPVAVGDFLILRAVRESGGTAIAVDEVDIETARVDAGRDEGFLLCPEGAATYAGYRKALADGLLEKDAEAVLFNCGSGLKYTMPDVSARLDRHGPVDFDGLVGTVPE